MPVDTTLPPPFPTAVIPVVRSDHKHVPPVLMRSAGSTTQPRPAPETRPNHCDEERVWGRLATVSGALPLPDLCPTRTQAPAAVAFDPPAGPGVPLVPTAAPSLLVG